MHTTEGWRKNYETLPKITLRCFCKNLVKNARTTSHKDNMAARVGPQDNAIAFVHDPVIAARRRLSAIMAGIKEQLDANRNRDALSSRLSEWFSSFREAALRNEDHSSVLTEHLPRLQRLLEEPQFRSDPFVRAVLNEFIPRLQALFTDRTFPEIPPNDPPIDDREERLRAIRARALEGAIQRNQRMQDNGEQLRRRVDAQIQQEFDEERQEIQDIFGRLMAENEDQELIERARIAIDQVEQRLTEAESAVPQLRRQVESNNVALSNLDRALTYAEQLTSQLEQAMRDKNEGGSSLLGTIFGVTLYIGLRIAASKFLPPGVSYELIPGGGLVKFPIPLQ
jgi:hypothetical protein